MFHYTRKPDWHAVKEVDYDEYWRSRGLEINKALKEREVLMLDRIPKGAAVLDIGCGNSRLPIALKEKGVQVTVADISREVLKLFASHGVPTHQLDLATITDQELGHYDYIILSEVLEHTTNPEVVVQTLRAHTKTFLITVPNSAFYRYRFHLMFAGRFFTQWVHHPSEHVRFWSYVDFCEWLEALDLAVDETVASNGFSFFGTLPFLKNMWKNLFGHQILYACSVEQ
jgi:methionine biosynthesis protein MetW